MLAQVMCQPTFPSNLNLKFGHFYMQFFFIRECFELHFIDQRLPIIDYLISDVIETYKKLVRHQTKKNTKIVL